MVINRLNHHHHHEVIQRQGWKVEQISFITGARSVNKQDLSKNLKFFNVSEASVHSTYSKLAMRVFDVYANILKCMYSTRFSGGPTRSEALFRSPTDPIVVTPLIRTIATFHPDKYKTLSRTGYPTPHLVTSSDKAAPRRPDPGISQRI
jgi:hypothetical protein